MAVWKNYLRRRRTRARRHRPWAPWELLQIVRERAAAGERVRAVGSGHSASAAPQPSEGGHFVELDHIAGEMPWPWYAVDGQYVRVGAGTTLAALNAMLDARGLALHNMGSWDGQTVAGATATGTHGSGLRHPPMCDRVVAIELVTDEKDPDSGARVQRFLRIEREGLTDVGAFEAARARFGDEDDPVRTLKLEPDDDLLNAARIHLGCFGVVYALTLEVRPRFWLKERPQVMTWDRVKEVPLEERARAHPEFFWMLCVPHRYAEGSPYAGQPLCVLIEREELRPRDGAAPRRDGVLDRLLRFGVQVVSTGLLENVGLFFPRLGQWVFRRDFEGRSVFSSASAEVMKTSLGPEVHAISIEAFVPLARAQEAVERIIALAEELETPNGRLDEGEHWHTSPIGVRFVAASEAWLAPSFDGPACAIEIPLLYDETELPWVRARHDRYRFSMLRRLELALRPLGARLHWGQHHTIDGAEAAARYGARWTRWKQVYARFNAYGSFSNPLTEQLELDPVRALWAVDAPAPEWAPE